MKFYVSALVGVIIKVILQNARCNNKDGEHIHILTDLDEIRYKSSPAPPDVTELIHIP